MPKLKVCIVGTGLIAKVKHIPAWKGLKDQVDLAAVCDLSVDSAKEVGRGFGIPQAYGDLAAMIKTEKPDIIDICTPPKTHCPLAIQAMDAGCNVMIEKPMAMDLQECDRIIESRDRNKVQVMCGHSDLFYHAFMKAKKMLSDGDIGKFRGMRIFLSTPRDYITSKQDHWGNKLPGGVIGETGPHVVYMTLPFIPKIEEVGVFARKILHEYPWSPFEDYRVTLVGEENLCSITLAYTNTEWLCQVEMLGESGMLRLDLETQSVVKYTRAYLGAKTAAVSQLREAKQLVSNTIAVGSRYATGKVASTHAIMAAEFVKAIKEELPSPVPAEEGRETVRVLGLIVQQLEEKYGTVPRT